MTTLRHILDHRFRANRAFDLIALDQLPERYRPDVPGGALGSDEVVALVPRFADVITVKILNREAAELVKRLSFLDFLPEQVRAPGGAAANAAIARLVLDGALEIENGACLASGPGAHATLFESSAGVRAVGRLALLSLTAVHYGQRLMIRDVETLSRRLYSFGTLPCSGRWNALSDATGEVAGILGLGRGGPATRVLTAEYVSMTLPNWLSWSHDDVSAADLSQLRFKLYVSPRPDELVRCFPRLVKVLADHRVRSFKVGRGIFGVLRPDKLVAYFDDYKHLQRVAGALADELHGCRPQGVPFTASASADGLISWGIDPSADERLLSSRPEESWRYWITNRLASALVHAQSATQCVEPWEFALDRLSLEGIDTVTWLPRDTAAEPSESS